MLRPVFRTLALSIAFTSSGAAALTALDCFQKHPLMASTIVPQGAVDFSDADMLAPIYVPGMKVKSFDVCYAYEEVLADLISFQPRVSNAEESTPLTLIGDRKLGVCSTWQSFRSDDSIRRLWVPEDPSVSLALRVHTWYGKIETFGLLAGRTVDWDFSI